MKKKIRTTRKRLLSVLLAVAMVLTALPLTALPAVAATSGDFAYWILSEEGKTCCISQYTGSETDVSIPYAIDGYTVTQIGDMESIFTNTPQVESVTIPAGVTEIWFSQDALYSPALRVVNIDPENPTYSSVDGVVFSKDKTELYLYPCAKADVTAYEIPYGVDYISVSAFGGCKNLVSITIPDSVTEIGEYAFSGCTSLESITIPDSVTSIGEDVFYGCTALTSITLPDSVTSIGDWTFSYCTSLTGVTIPNSVTRIGEYAFYNCTALTSITLPDSVTSLGWYVFEDCTALTSITIPYSVTSIGYGAFNGCTLLTTIYGYTGSYAETYANENDIPFETLGDVPLAFTYQILDDGTICITGFKGNPHVEDLIIPAVYEGYTVSGVGGSGFYSNLSLRSLTVEDGVKYIYEMAFGNCENLEQIVLPDSIEYIQVYFVDMSPSGAFYGTAYCKNPKNWDNGVLYMGNHAYDTEFIDGAEWTVFREGTLSIADMWICSQKVYIPRSVQHIGDRGWFSYYSDEEEEYKSSVVYGFAGSYAELFAKNHGYEFIDITPTISKPADGAAGLIELSYDQMTVGALVDELQYQDSTIQSIAVTDKSGNEVTDMNTICSSDMIFTATYFNGTTALFTVETTQTVLTGDVNGDDKINAVDARWVLQAASGARTFDTTQTAAADVNGDGKVNAVDARWILQVASGARTL